MFHVEYKKRQKITRFLIALSIGITIYFSSFGIPLHKFPFFSPDNRVALGIARVIASVIIAIIVYLIVGIYQKKVSKEPKSKMKMKGSSLVYKTLQSVFEEHPIGILTLVIAVVMIAVGLQFLSLLAGLGIAIVFGGFGLEIVVERRTFPTSAAILLGIGGLALVASIVYPDWFVLITTIILYILYIIVLLFDVLESSTIVAAVVLMLI